MSALNNWGSIASILGVIISAFFFFRHFKKKRESKIKKFKRPKESIKIKDFNFTDKKSTWWRYAEIGGCQSMVVCGVFRIESISDCETYLTAIRMKKPKFYGYLKVERAGASRGIFGNEIILERGSGGETIGSGGETTMIFTFHITPAVIEAENESAPEKKLFTADLEIFDQFGNKHNRKNVEFRFHGTQKFSDLDIVLPDELDHTIFQPYWAEIMKSGAEKRYSHS